MRRWIWERSAVKWLLSLLCLAGTSWPLPGQSPIQTSLPANTAVHVRLDHQLATNKTKAGETFSGALAEPLAAGGRTLFPAGTKVAGRVSEAVGCGPHQTATLSLELTEVGSMAIRTSLLRFREKENILHNVKLKGTDSSGGTIGFGIEISGGTANHYRTENHEILIPEGTVLVFNSQKDRTPRK